MMKRSHSLHEEKLLPCVKPLVFMFSWYDPFGNGGALGRRRPTNRTSSLKGGSMLHIPVGRAGPLVATQSMHKKLGPTNSYHSNIVSII